MQQNDLWNKVAHLELNIDYPIENCPIENQTNALISDTINIFYNKYNGTQCTIVYEYRDDCVSIVGLKMLATLASFMNFNPLIYGKVKKFKKELKTYKSVTEKQLKNMDNILYISSFNSIYEVTKAPTISKNFSIKEQFNIMEKFTPNEIITALAFYGYTDKAISKTDPLNDIKTFSFIKWINTLNPKCGPTDRIMDTIKKYADTELNINMVFISGDNKVDMTTLQEVEDSPYINLYYFEDKTDINKTLLNSNFKTDVWYRSNSPCTAYKNINEKLENLHASKTHIKLNWIGRWPQDFMQKVQEEI